MSDFLEFVDEVINGTPKYNVTDNVDGTKNIELANEVIQEGTPLNKSTLGNIGNILGYNYLQVEQEALGEIIDELIIGTVSGNSKIPNVANLDIYNATSTSINVINDSGKNAISFANMSGTIIIEVPENITKFSVKTNTTGSNLYLRGSNNKTSWTNVLRLNTSTYTQYHEVENTYKYYSFTPDYTSFTFYMADFKYDATTNKYTYNDVPTKNREILKCYVEYEGSASNNTLNNKQIDTILGSGKYYELMYDESNDRFIAHEERV